MKHLLLAAWACLGLNLCSHAQTLPTPPRALPLNTAPWPLDGHLDKPVWAQAPVHEHFLQMQPEDQRPARLRTTVQLIALGDALIFGIRAYDDAPERIRAPLVRRDQVRRDQDFVEIVLDPMGQRRHAQFVRVSASGVVADGRYSAQDDNMDFAPDFDVQAAVQRLPDGYSVELRWPLAELRYPYAGGQPWRLMVARSIPREQNVLDVSAPLSLDALSFIAELQPIEGLDDLVENVRERSFVRLRPELTLRQQRQSEPGQPHLQERSLNLGLEAKWRPRADWVIDASLNPDFSQVELDEPQLRGNTRYALSQQEKRPFFLESQDVTGQGSDEDGDASHGLLGFYSRAIADPSWGLRATWRSAQAEATAMSLQDKGGGPILRPAAYETRSHLPALSAQASFARLHAQLDKVGVAGLLSSRDYGQGRYNRVAGLELGGRWGDEAQWRGQALHSRTTLGFDAQGQAQQQAAQSGDALWLEARQRSKEWNSLAKLEQISPRFANDNGFVSQSGIRRLSLNLDRRMGTQSLPLPGSTLTLRAHEFDWQLHLQHTDTLADPELGVRGGEVLARSVHPGFWLTGDRGFEFWNYLALDEQRTRPGGTRHAPRSVGLGFMLTPAPWFGLLQAELLTGQRVDVEADRVGRGFSLNTQARLHAALPQAWALEWEPSLGYGEVRRPDGSQGQQEWTARSLAVLHLSAHQSLRAIWQGAGQSHTGTQSLTPYADRQYSQSLIYVQRLGGAGSWSLGCTQSAQHPESARQTECFGKLSLDLWR